MLRKSLKEEHEKFWNKTKKTGKGWVNLDQRPQKLPTRTTYSERINKSFKLVLGFYHYTKEM